MQKISKALTSYFYQEVTYSDKYHLDRKRFIKEIESGVINDLEKYWLAKLKDGIFLCSECETEKCFKDRNGDNGLDALFIGGCEKSKRIKEKSREPVKIIRLPS